MFKRIFLIVLDSVGVGSSKDAKEYEDEGANTLKNVIVNTNVNIPNLKSLGLYNILKIDNINTNTYYCKASPIGKGKDSTVGHYEIMGLKIDEPYLTFPNGVPEDLLNELMSKWNTGILGNKVASGTEIIKELWFEHLKTGYPIVYTSIDPVLQIAAHKDIIPLEKLYEMCTIARKITTNPKWKVSRVIARPFIGEYPNFIRTEERKDYTLNPPSKTVLDSLKENNYEVISIGKISDLFNGCGITKQLLSGDNKQNIELIINIMNLDFNGLCFVNLNDFDTKYGHRNNVEGYANSLEEFDKYIPSILEKLRDDDLLIITADHGNDPIFKGTNHTREDVPVIMYSKKFKSNGRLENFKTFANIGATIADNFDVELPIIGESILSKLL